MSDLGRCTHVCCSWLEDLVKQHTPRTYCNAHLVRQYTHCTTHIQLETYIQLESSCDENAADGHFRCADTEHTQSVPYLFVTDSTPPTHPHIHRSMNITQERAVP